VEQASRTFVDATKFVLVSLNIGRLFFMLYKVLFECPVKDIHLIFPLLFLSGACSWVVTYSKMCACCAPTEAPTGHVVQETELL